LAASAGIIYALGFFVTCKYLSKYGITPQLMIQPAYILTGVLTAAYILMPPVFILSLCDVALRWHVIKEYRLTIPFVVACFFIVPSMVIAWALGYVSGCGIAPVLQYWKFAALLFLVFWRPLSVTVAMLSSGRHYRYGHKVPKSIHFVASLIFLVLVTDSYISTVHANSPYALGGGKPRIVDVYTTAEGAELAKSLGLTVDTIRTPVLRQVSIVYEDNKGLFIKMANESRTQYEEDGSPHMTYTHVACIRLTQEVICAVQWDVYSVRNRTHPIPVDMPLDAPHYKGQITTRQTSNEDSIRSQP